MDWIKYLMFKWLMAAVYFGLLFAVLLLFPASVWPFLVAVYGLYAFYSIAVTDAEVSREYDLRPLTPWDVADYAQFRAWLAQSAREAGLSREPHYAVAESDIPNAFAVGGLRGIVIFTTGALKLWTPEELAAVAGHELKHLASRDSLPAMLGGAWLQLLGWISAWLHRIAQESATMISGMASVFALVLDVALAVTSYLADLSMAQRSRYAEHQADLAGARLTSAAAMISALAKLEAKRPHFTVDENHPKWSAGWIAERLHASHPPTAVRIRFLEAAAERGEIRAV